MPLWHYILTFTILPLKPFLINADIYAFFQHCVLSSYFVLCYVKCWVIAVVEVGTALCRMIRDGLLRRLKQLSWGNSERSQSESSGRG